MVAERGGGVSDNLDSHKSEQLYSLLIEGERAVAKSAHAPEHLGLTIYLLSNLWLLQWHTDLQLWH